MSTKKGLRNKFVTEVYKEKLWRKFLQKVKIKLITGCYRSGRIMIRRLLLEKKEKLMSRLLRKSGTKKDYEQLLTGIGKKSL
jgi:hypothetical protein